MRKGGNLVAHSVVDHSGFLCWPHRSGCLSGRQSDGSREDDPSRNRRLNRGRLDCQADLEAQARTEIPCGRFIAVYRRCSHSSVCLATALLISPEPVGIGERRRVDRDLVTLRVPRRAGGSLVLANKPIRAKIGWGRASRFRLLEPLIG